MPKKNIEARIELLEESAGANSTRWGYNYEDELAVEREAELAAAENRDIREQGLNPKALAAHNEFCERLAECMLRQAEYEALSTPEKIECKRREIAEIDAELASSPRRRRLSWSRRWRQFEKQLLELELMALEGASEDDLAIATYMAYEQCRKGQEVERPASVEDLPYGYWPESRRKAHEDASAARAWEEQHRQRDWQRDREDAEEGEIVPRAALPRPARRLPAPEAEWVSGSPEQAEVARAMVHFEPGPSG